MNSSYKAFGSEPLAEITVIGRRTGKQISLTVQFVYDSNRIYLLPFMGTKTNWYMNLKLNPAVSVKIGGRRFDGKGRTFEEEPSKLKSTLEKFVAKYGEKNIAKYYPRKDAFVEVEIG
jgi:deazaflavin-dependent oxidoreductase (nitroreductase family)